MTNLALRLAAIEIWLIGALVVASLFWSQLLIVVVVTAVLMWGARRVALGYFSQRTPVDWGIFILAGMALLSLTITYIPEITIVQVLRLFSGIALFYALVNWGLSARRLDVLLGLLLISGIGLALFSLISVEWAITKVSFLPKTIFDRLTILVADTANPNVMAGNLILLAPIAFSLLIYGATPIGHARFRGIIRGLVVFSFIITSLVILLTLSRAAWIAYLLAICAIAMMRWRAGWIALISLLLIGVWVFSRNSTGVLESLLALQNLGSVAGRVEVWNRAIFMIEDYPLTGIGMGLFRNVAELYYPFALVSLDRVTHAHNLYFQIALDLGLPGLIAWLAILFGVAGITLRLYHIGKKTGNNWLAGAGAGLFGSVFAMTSHGFLDAVTWGGVRPAPLVWLVWGCAFALSGYHLKFQKE